MVEIAQKAQKIGGSLMVRIPKEIADATNIHEGDTVYFNPQKQRKSLLGAFPGLGPWKKEDPRNVSKYG